MEHDELVKEIPYGNTNKIIIKRDGNPYGFFTARLAIGTTPKECEGYFTSIRDAERAVHKAITNRAQKGSNKNAT